MRDSDETLVRAGYPENDVCEREVSEKLPVTYEKVKPLDVRIIRAALGEHEVGER
jgi:hypothetical protein